MNANKPTGRRHKFVTLQDVLSLDEAELIRFLPDFVAWHKVCSGIANLEGCQPSDLGASMVWVDDGAGDLLSVRVSHGDESFDLLKPETWPKAKSGVDIAKTEAGEQSTQTRASNGLASN